MNFYSLFFWISINLSLVPTFLGFQTSRQAPPLHREYRGCRHLVSGPSGHLSTQHPVETAPSTLPVDPFSFFSCPHRMPSSRVGAPSVTLCHFHAHTDHLASSGPRRPRKFSVLVEGPAYLCTVGSSFLL